MKNQRLHLQPLKAILAIIVRGVAQPGSVSVWGAGGRKFKSCHPDKGRNQKTPKACKSNDLQAFLFLRCQNKPYKTVVNVN